mmetsp:Transcript_4297/g.6079  ORF Transcript_4297/g.6079 Transcript_4297/m.6079 type:complete len:97 (+) Transcript_4297:499-789(+)
MCDELKDQDYMFSFVEEIGGTSLCSVASGSGCSGREIEYANKWQEKEMAEISSEKTRLGKMLESDPKLKSDSKKWIKQRLAILKQLEVASAGTSEL